MYQGIKNWHLLFLVGIVSIISISLAQEYVFAQWNIPSTLPGDTGNFSLVVNPLVENLDLDGNDIISANVIIYGDGDAGTPGNKAIDITVGKELCLGGFCYDQWPGSSAIEGSGTVNTIAMFTPDGAHVGDSPLVLSSPSGYRNVAFNDTGVVIDNINIPRAALVVYDEYPAAFPNIDETPFVIDEAGRVGIGTDSPNTGASDQLLHIQSPSGNAEIDIQSGSGTHWGIYQNGVNGPLNFWNTDNRVAFTNNGIELVSGAANPYPEFIWKNSGYTKSSAKIATVINDTGTWARRGLAFFTNNVYDISTDSVERMRITEIGNVGIGTMNPTTKLEVSGDTLITGNLEVLGTALGNGGLLWSSGNDGHGSGLDADTVDGKHDGEFDANFLGGYEMQINDDGPGGANPQICVNSGACNYSTEQCSPRTSVSVKSACTVVSDCNSVCANLNPSNFTCSYNCNGNYTNCDINQTDHVTGNVGCTTVTASECLTPPEAEFPGSCRCLFEAPSVSYGKATITDTWFCADTI